MTTDRIGPEMTDALAAHLDGSGPAAVHTAGCPSKGLEFLET
jgi:hypothetical protein